MDLASYVALAQEDKIKMYDQSYANYKKAHPCIRYQKALKSADERLSKYFKEIKPVTDRVELCSLQKWYCETRDKVVQPKEEFFEEYFYQKASLLVYSTNSLADHLTMIKKEGAEILRLLSSDIFDYVDEITSLFSTFVSCMNSKRLKDYEFIEKTYQDMLTEQRIEVSKLVAVNDSRQLDMMNMKRSIHNMRSKITNNYMLINQLRNERDFAKEYASIIELENKSITETMTNLCDGLKIIDADFEKFKQYRVNIEESIDHAAYSKSTLVNQFNGRPLGLTVKHRYEINKILEEVNETEQEEFMTHERCCSTADLLQVTSVSVSFAEIKKNKDVSHKGFQKTEAKPKSQSVYIQADLLRKSELDEDKSKSNNKSNKSEDDSAKDSAYSRKVKDRFKIENMLVPAPGGRKSLYRQQSLIPDTISELLEQNTSYDDKADDTIYVPSGINAPSKTSRASKINSKNLTSIMRKPNFIKKNTVVEGNSSSVSPENMQISLNFSNAVKKFEKRLSKVDESSPDSQQEFNSPRRLVTQKTMGNIKRDMESLNNSLNDSIVVDKQEIPKSTTDLNYTLPNMENIRENKLRNELIRQKQQFKTLSNRLMICGDDNKRSLDIQTMLGTTTANIDKLEHHLKRFRKTNFNLGERMTPVKILAGQSPSRHY